jgi:hypothetical protein
MAGSAVLFASPGHSERKFVEQKGGELLFFARAEDLVAVQNTLRIERVFDLHTNILVLAVRFV